MLRNAVCMWLFGNIQKNQPYICITATFFNHALADGLARNGYAAGRLLFEVIFDGLTGGAMKVANIGVDALKNIDKLDFDNSDDFFELGSKNAVNQNQLTKCKIPLLF